MKVGYLSDADPLDRWTWSGTHLSMYRALEAQGLDVVHVGRSLVPPPDSLVKRAARRLGLGPAPTPPEPPVARARRQALAAARELAERPVDVLFAPVASGVAPFLETPVPIVYSSDATFRLLRGYYAEVTALPEEVAREHDELESRSIRKARALVYPSAWAAASAVADYGMAAERVHVVALGANLDEVPSAAEAVARGRGPVCRLLFIGRDWVRKGGALALSALGELRALGVDAELTICGAEPPGGGGPGVTVFRNLDKKKAADRATLRRLLLESHFLVLPTRADCFSMVSCEAAAHGLPVVITRTGGIPGVIDEGRNGFMVPLEADGAAWARTIAAAYESEERYDALVRSSRAVYDEKLNWGAWGRAVRTILERAAAEAAS